MLGLESRREKDQVEKEWPNKGRLPRTAQQPLTSGWVRRTRFHEPAMQDPSKRADSAAKRIGKKKGEVVGRKRKKRAFPGYTSWRELMMLDPREIKVVTRKEAWKGANRPRGFLLDGEICRDNLIRELFGGDNPSGNPIVPFVPAAFIMNRSSDPIGITTLKTFDGSPMQKTTS